MDSVNRNSRKKKNRGKLKNARPPDFRDNTKDKPSDLSTAKMDSMNRNLDDVGKCKNTRSFFNKLNLCNMLFDKLREQLPWPELYRKLDKEEFIRYYDNWNGNRKKLWKHVRLLNKELHKLYEAGLVKEDLHILEKLLLGNDSMLVEMKKCLAYSIDSY